MAAIGGDGSVFHFGQGAGQALPHFRGQFGLGMVEDLAEAAALFSPALLEPDNKALPEPPFQGAVCNHPVAAHGMEWSDRRPGKGRPQQGILLFGRPAR